MKQELGSPWAGSSESIRVRAVERRLTDGRGEARIGRADDELGSASGIEERIEGGRDCGGRGGGGEALSSVGYWAAA